MLYLSKQQAEQLIAQAKKEAPNEACGILAGPPLAEAGEQKRIEKIYPMTNQDQSAVSFFMDPQEQLRVIKEIRSLGLEMVGIYHSHPQSQAYPSTRDVSLAFYPETSYVIVSLKDQDKPTIKSFKIIKGKISEEEVKVVDSV